MPTEVDVDALFFIHFSVQGQIFQQDLVLLISKRNAAFALHDFHNKVTLSLHVIKLLVELSIDIFPTNILKINPLRQYL